MFEPDNAHTLMKMFDAGAQRYGLTVRERQVMWRVFCGDTSPQIAQMLNVTANTVIAHVNNVAVKTSAPRRNASLARMLGLLE